MKVKAISKRDHAIVFYLDGWEVDKILKAAMIERIYSNPSLVKFMDQGWKIEKEMVDFDEDSGSVNIAFFFSTDEKEEEVDAD